jgi:hypothetical protein
VAVTTEMRGGDLERCRRRSRDVSKALGAAARIALRGVTVGVVTGVLVGGLVGTCVVPIFGTLVGAGFGGLIGLPLGLTNGVALGIAVRRTRDHRTIRWIGAVLWFGDSLPAAVVAVAALVCGGLGAWLAPQAAFGRGPAHLRKPASPACLVLRAMGIGAAYTCAFVVLVALLLW